MKTMLETLETETLLLTPNQRLGRELRIHYDRQQLQSGKSTWQSPSIVSIDEYLRSLWGQHTAAGITPCADQWLMTDLQEQLLWQRMIEQHADSAFIASESAAREMMGAYRTLGLWHLGLQDDPISAQFQLHDDTALFYRCALAFLTVCREEDCIAEADISAVLGELPPPPFTRLVLYGFEEIVPAYAQLIERWGLPCEHVQPEGQPGSCQRVSCATERSEYASAAVWARDAVRHNANARIGIIVPELQARRASVEYAFTECFEPHYFRPETERHGLPFNISSGASLASAPLVQSALSVLGLNRNALAIEELASLLHSPFFVHGQTRLTAYIELENRLRHYQDEKISLSTLVYQCNGKGLDGDKSLCPALANTVQRFRQLQSVGKKTMQAWVEVFSKQLDGFGWPGERALDSVEAQQYDRWHEALDAVRTLTAVTGRVYVSDALHAMRQVLRHTVFQPQNGSSPVQILGALEGAGLPFTHVWLCGLDNQHWPPVARPNAYLPLALQRELNMPHCGPEREYQFARQLLDGYKINSDNLVLSYAQQVDQQTAGPSTMIADIEEMPLAQFVQPHQDLTLVPTPIALETIVSEKAHALQASDVLRGGVAIYANQAACPFRAFATHRLHARKLETACTGISALQRGIVVHHCLETIWSELGSQASLLQKTDEQLHDMIARAVDDAITVIGKKMQMGIMHKLLELECVRLQALLTLWLEKEAQREPFTVKHCEYDIAVDIAGRTTQLRIDRIDELEDGSYVLIDYKTGPISGADWLGEPVRSPQLPFYTIRLNAANNDLVRGIALARVDLHEPKWVGIGGGADVGFPATGGARAKKETTSWDDCIAQWRVGIDDLDVAFREGRAVVEPVAGKTSCRHCDLKPVCRIPKRQFDSNENEEINHGG